MSDAILIIAVQDAQLALKDDMTTGEMLLAAMKRAQNFWLAADEDLRLRGAVGAVLTQIGQDHDDYNDLVASIESLKTATATLNALQAGVAVDFDNMPEPVEPRFPLMKLWHESK